MEEGLERERLEREAKEQEERERVQASASLPPVSTLEQKSPVNDRIREKTLKKEHSKGRSKRSSIEPSSPEKLRSDKHESRAGEKIERESSKSRPAEGTKRHSRRLEREGSEGGKVPVVDITETGEGASASVNTTTSSKKEKESRDRNSKKFSRKGSKGDLAVDGEPKTREKASRSVSKPRRGTIQLEGKESAGVSSSLNATPNSSLPPSGCNSTVSSTQTSPAPTRTSAMVATAAMMRLDGKGTIGRRDSLSLAGLQQITESKDSVHDSMVESGTKLIDSGLMIIFVIISFACSLILS
jgi:hypothetical protein